MQILNENFVNKFIIEYKNVWIKQLKTIGAEASIIGKSEIDAVTEAMAVFEMATLDIIASVAMAAKMSYQEFLDLLKNRMRPTLEMERIFKIRWKRLNEAESEA